MVLFQIGRIFKHFLLQNVRYTGRKYYTPKTCTSFFTVTLQLYLQNMNNQLELEKRHFWGFSKQNVVFFKRPHTMKLTQKRQYWRLWQLWQWCCYDFFRSYPICTRQKIGLTRPNKIEFRSDFTFNLITVKVIFQAKAFPNPCNTFRILLVLIDHSKTTKKIRLKL